MYCILMYLGCNYALKSPGVYIKRITDEDILRHIKPKGYQ